MSRRVYTPAPRLRVAVLTRVIGVIAQDSIKLIFFPRRAESSRSFEFAASRGRVHRDRRRGGAIGRSGEYNSVGKDAERQGQIM